MCAVNSRRRLSTQDVFAERLAVLLFYVQCLCFLWLALQSLCPLYTFQNLHDRPGENSRVHPIPPAPACQCLDSLPISVLLHSQLRSIHLLSIARSRFHFLPFLLLLAGDVEINPGPWSVGPRAINLAHPNTCSIASCFPRDKPAILQEMISDNSIEIITLNETWLSPDELPSTLASFTPPNFTLLNAPRLTGRGGGVAILHRSYLKLKQLTIPTYNSFESLFANFQIGSMSYNILTIYRPPLLSVTAFMADFSSLIENIVSSPSELIITGDFNFHIDLPLDVASKRFLKLLDTFGLQQNITFPTHKKGHILDLLISRKLSNIIGSVDFVNPHISDHYALLATIDIPIKTRPLVTEKTYRRINKIDLSTFKDDLRNSEMFNNTETTASVFADIIHSAIAQVLDKHAPFVKSRCPARSRKPFITEDILAAKKIRSRYETKYRKSRTPADLAAYKIQSNLVSKMITKSRRIYYRSLIAENSSKPKKLWATLNSLLHRKSEPVLPTFTSISEITNSFLKYFNNKITTLCSNLPIVFDDPMSVPLIQPPVLAEFAWATVDEIILIVKNGTDSTCLLDALPTPLLKSCIDVLAQPLTRLVNMCISEGLFPVSLKSALISPLLKKPGLPKENFCNYRPISNLSFVSKLIERIIHARIMSHINSFKTFSPFQSAYRKFHSTETALLRIQNDLLLSIDRQQVSALILLDLSAAFDTIDHGILLHRLEMWFGISGPALALLSSYLHDRVQSVTIDGSSSNPLPLLTGVPQGSVLGPLLFTMYTTPLAHILNDSVVKFHLYADDTQLYISFPSTDSAPALAILSEILDTISKWFNSNKLSLNPTKTEYLIIGNRLQAAKLTCKTLKFNNSDLLPVHHARNLGVVFDSELSSKNHINKLAQSTYFHIRQLRRIRPFLDLSSAILLANALVSSRIDYCNSLFYGLPNSQIDRLQRIQNSLARVMIPSVKKTDHIQPVLRRLHWLPVEQRIVFKIATLTFKTISHGQPAYLRDLITVHAPTRMLRSASRHLLVVPRIDSANGRRSFSYAAPFVWNSLPDDVRSCTSLETFRSGLKTHLFPP